MASRALLKAIDAGDYDAARRVAAHWHGGSDTNITGLSHGMDWSTEGLIGELTRLLEGNRAYPQEQVDEDLLDARAELESLLGWADGTWNIVSVDSAYGHRFLAEDGTEKCLTCGAQYELVHNGADKISGRYRNAWGHSPEPCTGDDHDRNDRCNCLEHS